MTLPAQPSPPAVPASQARSLEVPLPLAAPAPTATLRRLCVFCGSRDGSRQSFVAEGRALGAALAKQGLGVVYGGAAVGVMGAVADGALAAGGEVIGVIPRALAHREIFHEGLTTLHVVGSMHERKALMAELSDGFIALPGGFGTFDELCEILTWAQLGIHRKPVGLLNVARFYDPLLTFFDHTLEEGFITAEHRHMVNVDSTPQGLVEKLRNHIPPSLPRWMEASQA